MRLEVDERRGVTLVGRGWWGAEDVEDTTPLDLPVTWVRFACEDITGGGEKDIIDALMDTQAKYMEQDYNDIPYNFIVDVTGTVYEGRGWKVEAQRPSTFTGLDRKCLDVCYVGDFRSEDTNPVWEQLTSAIYLLIYGINKKFISPKYKTIGWRDESGNMRETADTTWHNYEQDGMVWNGLRWKKKDEPPDEDESYEKPFLLEEPGITLPPRSPMEDHPDWPEVVDPELEAMEYDDPYAEEKKPLIFEDMRYDPSKPDITYLPPWLRKYVPPPTRQSMREGEEMMFKPCYIDDDPRNTWVYKDPHIPKISTIVRKEWGALGWKPKRPLNVPVRNMRITYTGGETDNYPEAFRIVQNLQKKHRQAGLDDIAWNWIIGKDGAIYEGRGWYADAKRPKGWEHLSGDCLDICYLGDFDEKDPPWYLLKSTIDIMRYAMEINVLDPNFKLIQLRSNPK